MSSKYRAIKTAVDGIMFASKHEAGVYSQLKLLERECKIRDLRLQPKFPIVINDVKICTYIADFEYIDNETGKYIVVDAKGVRTPVYRIKKKLVKAMYGIDIVEM